MFNIKEQAVRLKLSAYWSYALAVGKLIFAIMTSSLFLGINAFYTGIIAYGKGQSVLGLGENYEKCQKWHYRRIGFIILIASVIYLIYSLGLFFSNQNSKYDKTMAMAIAVITFFEIGLNLTGIIKANKNNDLMLQAAKLLNLSSALIGLVLTQTAILSFSSSQNHSMANMISSALFSSVAILIGISMMYKKFPHEKVTENTTSE